MAEAKVTDTETKGKRILLVDDQAQNRDMLGRRLERRGYEVVLRDTAVGIEEVIVQEKIELVLLEACYDRKVKLEAM
jgi:DNA-binding NtrC family response regulator